MDNGPPQPPRGPTEHDPLAHLTAALRGLIARTREIDRLELESQDDETAANRLLCWRDTNARAIDHLEQAMAAVPAADARDAVVQVLVALGRIKNLEDRLEEAAIAEELSAVRLLLRSALRRLAEHVGVDLGEHGADHYGVTEDTAPFLPARGEQ